MVTTERQDATAPPASANVRGRIVSLVALRLLLIFATAFLLLAQNEAFRPTSPLPWVIVLAAASNLALLWLPRRWLVATQLLAAVILLDTGWVSLALFISGHFHPEFFYLYFLVLFVAAIGENLRLIVLGAAAIGVAYLYNVLSTSADPSISAETLIRIPFLLAVAAFYGYLVDRVRRTQRKADSKRRALARIAQANQDLELEVAQRKQAQEELSKLSRAVEQSPAMVIITDTHGTIEYVNPRYCSTTGYPESELLGRSLRRLNLVQEGEGAEDPWSILGRGGEWRGESSQRTKEGKTYWASTCISPIRNADGSITHLVAVQEDLTHIKEAEEALKKANEDLQRLSQMKSDFVSTVSHELRTPLTAMKNALDILKTPDAGPLTPDQDRFLAIAQRNVVRLHDLVSDILDLSRIEAGGLRFAFSAVELSKLLDEIVASLDPQAQTKRVSLELSYPSSPLPKVWADPGRLEQVLVNLLGNALKFTPEGGRVKLGAASAQDSVELSVTDSGVGLSADDQRHIFERFYQVDDTLTRNTRGSGLGLSIAQDMVEAQGGRLAVESELNKGTRFFFRIPLHTPRATEMTELDANFREYRSYPFFGVLVITLDSDSSDAALSKAETEALRSRLARLLPRRSDRIQVLPANRQAILALLGTDVGGTRIVLRRLQKEFTKWSGNGAALIRPRPEQILGPGSFPEDGQTAWQILEAIFERQDQGVRHDQDTASG